MLDAPDLEALSPAELTDLMCQLQAIENAIRARKLAAFAVYDNKEWWKDEGATSMPSWLVGMLGFGRDTANEEVRVAHRFTDLPALHAAFADGSLSWDQSRAVSEFATPKTDGHLTAEAKKFSAPQLRRMARRFRPVPDEVAAQAITERALDMWWDLEANLLRFKGQLPAGEGALFEKTIDRLARRAAEDVPCVEGAFNYSRLRADALSELVGAYVGADPDADRATIGVHVDASVLAGTTGMAELEGGSAIALETARRLACDARWYVVVDGPDGLPVGIGRVGRQIPAWLAREVKHRDGCCRFPGCNRKGWTNIHHVVAWGEGGPTDLDNLLLLCGTHHRLVHEGGFTIDGSANGEIAFVSPSGFRFAQGPPAMRDELRGRVAALGGDIAIGGPAP